MNVVVTYVGKIMTMITIISKVRKTDLLETYFLQNGLETILTILVLVNILKFGSEYLFCLCIGSGFLMILSCRIQKSSRTVSASSKRHLF